MKYKTPSCCRSSFGFHFCDSDFRSCILFGVLRQGCLMRIYARNIEVFVSKYKMALLLVWRICTLCAQNNKRENVFCALWSREFFSANSSTASIACKNSSSSSLPLIAGAMWQVTMGMLYEHPPLLSEDWLLLSVCHFPGASGWAPRKGFSAT